jgi:multidrug efflux system membrane fusion protein
VQLYTEPHAVLVPTSAVTPGQDGEFVFVVKSDNTVEVRPVTSGIVVGDRTVIEKGIAAGDRVVTDGQSRLTPGAKIEIAAPPPAIGAAAKSGGTGSSGGTP